MHYDWLNTSNIINICTNALVSSMSSLPSVETETVSLPLQHTINFTFTPYKGENSVDDETQILIYCTKCSQYRYR